MNKELSVIVSSCDKYSHLLPYFTKLFDKYWDCKDRFDKYICVESVDINFPGYKTIHTGDTNWSNSLAKTLSHVDTPYVFIILDDFWPIRHIETGDIERGLKIAKEHNLDKYIFHYPHVVFEGKLDATGIAPNIFKVQQNSEYTMTVQPGLWNVEYLTNILDGENPWEFEISGSARANEKPHKIFMEIISPYHEEAMSRGQFTPSYYNIIQREGL
jgi:hypothetical protein